MLLGIVTTREDETTYWLVCNSDNFKSHSSLAINEVGAANFQRCDREDGGDEGEDGKKGDLKLHLVSDWYRDGQRPAYSSHCLLCRDNASGVELSSLAVQRVKSS